MKNILISFIFIIIANLPVIAFSSQIKDENTILFINQYDYSGPISASLNKEKNQVKKYIKSNLREENIPVNLNTLKYFIKNIRIELCPAIKSGKLRMWISTTKKGELGVNANIATLIGVDGDISIGKQSGIEVVINCSKKND